MFSDYHILIAMYRIRSLQMRNDNFRFSFLSDDMSMYVNQTRIYLHWHETCEKPKRQIDCVCWFSQFRFFYHSLLRFSLICSRNITPHIICINAPNIRHTNRLCLLNGFHLKATKSCQRNWQTANKPTTFKMCNVELSNTLFGVCLNSNCCHFSLTQSNFFQISMASQLFCSISHFFGMSTGNYCNGEKDKSRFYLSNCRDLMQFENKVGKMV